MITLRKIYYRLLLIMKKVYILYAIFILGMFEFLYGEKSPPLNDSILFISGDMLGYLNNLEYYNGIREGEPFFGYYIQFRFSYKPINKIEFSAGIHARKSIGDKSFFSDIRPLFRAKYEYKNFTAILGELYYKDRHGLFDGLLREQFIYNPVVEEGIQFLYQNNFIQQDIWAAYPRLNTPKHREKLIVGNSTFLTFKSIVLSFLGYITHFGGQLFAPENDPVRENATAAIGITYKINLNSKVEEIGFEQILLGSGTTDTNENSNRKYDGGWGSLSHIWISIIGFKCGFSFYKGNDFITWEGNPMYNTNSPYYFFDVSKSVTFPKNVFLNFGFRLDFFDMYPHEYFKNGDHQIWFNLGCNFNRKIR